MERAIVISCSPNHQTQEVSSPKQGSVTSKQDHNYLEKELQWKQQINHICS